MELACLHWPADNWLWVAPIVLKKWTTILEVHRHHLFPRVCLLNGFVLKNMRKISGTFCCNGHDLRYGNLVSPYVSDNGAIDLVRPRNGMSHAGTEQAAWIGAKVFWIRDFESYLSSVPSKRHVDCMTCGHFAYGWQHFRNSLFIAMCGAKSSSSFLSTVIFQKLTLLFWNFLQLQLFSKHWPSLIFFFFETIEKGTVKMN